MGYVEDMQMWYYEDDKIENDIKSMNDSSLTFDIL